MNQHPPTERPPTNPTPTPDTLPERALFVLAGIVAAPVAALMAVQTARRTDNCA